MNNILDDHDQKETFSNRHYRLWISSVYFLFFVIGIMFKIMHWPGSYVLILISASGGMSYNFFYFRRLRGKHWINNGFIALYGVWLLFLFQRLVTGYGIFNFRAIVLHMVVALLFWGILELVSAIRKSRRKD